MSERAARLDTAGLLVAALLVAWTLVASAVGGANPLPALAAMAAAGGALVLGRATTTAGRPRAAAVVAVAGASLLFVAIGRLTSIAGPPLGYENANAQLFLQAAAAALLVAAGWATRPVRLAGAAAAAAFGLAVVATGSRAGLLLLPLPLLGLIPSPGRWVRVWTAIAAVGFVAALVSTVVIAGIARERPAGRARSGATARDGEGPGQVRAGSSIRDAGRRGPAIVRDRISLWRGALVTMSDHPVFGVGPGGFPQPGARADRDRRWAHHEFLQAGAETGVPGFVLLGLVFLWGFGRLLVAPSDRLTGVAAGSLAALGTQATVDYVLHFPAIVAAAAAVAGTAQAARDRSAVAAGPGSLSRKALKALALPLGLASRRRPGDVAVLLYHRVGDGGREVDLPVGAFRRQLAELTARHRVLGLDQALEDAAGGGVVLTFDDGYRDFHEHVLPELVAQRVPAVLYLATGLVVEEGGDAGQGLSWRALKEAVDSGLVTVGSHTHSHANLGNAAEHEAEDEMRRSKELIEERLDVACRHFAYPWGVGSPGADRAVRRLFASAALPWGTNRAGKIDPYRLARLPVLRSDGPVLFRAKVAGMLDREAALYRLAGRGPWRRR